MPVRIYDISKKLGIENKDVLVKAKALGIAFAKVPSSVLDKISAEYLEEELIKDRPELAARLAPKPAEASRPAVMEEKVVVISAPPSSSPAPTVMKSPAPSPKPERDQSPVLMGLANFKAFSWTQNLPIKPITLIFGANSAGKSSIIHGALLAHEAVTTGNLDVYKTKLAGDSVDLGGFRQYVHRRRVAERVEWSINLEPRYLQASLDVLSTSRAVKVSLFFGMSLDDKGNPQNHQPPRLALYEIEADGKLIIRLGKREDGSMQILRFDENALNPILLVILKATTTATQITEHEQKVIGNIVNDLLPKLRFRCDPLLPTELIGEDHGPVLLQQMVPISKENREAQLAKVTRQFLPGIILEAIKVVNFELRAQLDKIVYLGPLRSLPPRHLAFTEATDRNWFAGGIFAWDRLRKDAVVREKVNQWLSSPGRLKTPYRLEVERFFTATEVKTSLEEGFESIGSELVARLLHDTRNMKEETANLLNARDEIQMEQNKLNLELTKLLIFWKEVDASLANATRTHESMHNGLRQMHARREHAVNNQRAGDQNQGLVISKLNYEIDLQEKGIAEANRNIKAFGEQRQELSQREGKIRGQLNELQRRKDEIFSGLKADLDVPAIVKQLYETIQNRPEQDPVDELVLIDCRSSTRVSHCDVGIGVSQMLPVLVHAYANQEKIIAIEQPEIHLHPALQAELGDVFIESALGSKKNTFLLETHSEHLILRIMRRIRETHLKKLPKDGIPITSKDVSILFVEPDGDHSIIREMPLNDMGELIKAWPGGFFEEGMKELFP